MNIITLSKLADSIASIMNYITDENLEENEEIELLIDVKRLTDLFQSELNNYIMNRVKK
ncbi:hypothetical protein [Sulfolobus spindle-shaped virus]|nr:hypothetical protein [Sulfolobus spindle-shaped virus]AZG03336.1 hypothetical protein [Sulfolobus spindle-shaped virus]